ncbi:unnamed protein product [Urochloa humidicola]
MAVLGKLRCKLQSQRHQELLHHRVSVYDLIFRGVTGVVMRLMASAVAFASMSISLAYGSLTLREEDHILRSILDAQ